VSAAPPRPPSLWAQVGSGGKIGASGLITLFFAARVRTGWGCVGSLGCGGCPGWMHALAYACNGGAGAAAPAGCAVPGGGDRMPHCQRNPPSSTPCSIAGQHAHPPLLPPCPSCQGFLSPASRGSLLTAALVMYLLLSVAAGYSAVWLWGLVNRSYEGWFKVGT